MRKAIRPRVSAGVPDALLDALAHRGLEVTEEDTDGSVVYLVRGDTFPLNEELLSVGGIWDPSSGAWRLSSAESLEALLEGQERRGDRRASTGFREEIAAYEGLQLDPLLARLLEIGPRALTQEELLEVFLSFGSYPRQAEATSVRLFSRFGSIGAIFAADATQLKVIPYIDDRTIALLKAIQVAIQRVLHEPLKDRPVIGSWSALIDYLQVALAHEPIEQFRLLFLDRKNILIRDEIQQRGTVDHTPLYPREIVKRALELQACAIIMVHNHPSGDPTPSRTDLEMTRQVVQALGAVGIAVHDHVIVGKNRHTSLRSQRLI